MNLDTESLEENRKIKIEILKELLEDIKIKVINEEGRSVQQREQLERLLINNNIYEVEQE